MQTKLRSTVKNVAAKRIRKAQILHKDGVGRWEGDIHWDTFLSIPTQIPRQALTQTNVNRGSTVIQNFFLDVPKMLLGIYISLHPAGNLFSGLRPRNLILKVFQSIRLPSPPPPPPRRLIRNEMGRPLPQMHFIFTHFKFKVSKRLR